MSHCLRLLGLAALLAAFSLPAQTGYFYSADNDPTTGNSNVCPFGNGSATYANQRAHFLVKQANLPARPALLQSLGFAPTGGGNYLFSALLLLVGHNATGSLSATFAANFSQPPTPVFNAVDLNWPVTANSWCRLPVDRPFVYNGQDHLVLEVLALGSDKSPKAGFHRGSEPRAREIGFTPLPALAPYGAGCSGPPLCLPRTLPELRTQAFELGLAQAAPLAPALLLFGASRSTFGPLPLPLDLAPLGAPGCALLTSTQFGLAALADPTGSARLALPLPADPALEGARLYFQWAAVDPGANPLGLAFSAGLEAVTGTGWPATAPVNDAAGTKIELGFL